MLWYFIYLIPLLFLFVLTKTKASFKIQKKRQTWLFFIEIYYISLFFTMLTTKISDGYFFLWNGQPQYEIILERFFTSFAIYQIWILVTRNLNVSADLDSYITLKFLINKIIVALEAGNTSLAINIRNDFLKKSNEIGHVMFNEESRNFINILEKENFESDDILIGLKLEIVNIELIIDSLSLTWNQSFLLNFFK